MTKAADQVAIIGLGALVPDAHDPWTFWAQQAAGHVAIGRLPIEVWDASMLADRSRKDPDKSATTLGATIGGLPFEPKEFGLPPLVAQDLDLIQKATLLAARQALADAGIRGPTDGMRAAFVLGNGFGGMQLYSERQRRVYHPTLEETIRRLPAFQAYPARHRQRFFDELREAWRDQNTPPNGADSLPGLLGNVAAARVMHHWNLHGPSMCVDAACASGLAALESAVMGLRARRYDFALCGATDFLMDAAASCGFSAMGALSPDGSFPFDRRANGFIMSEASVVFALKRLEDAERDNDRIYAVVRGIGSASDGKGRSIVAPNPDGQVRAMAAAWREAGLDPSRVGYLEAHGTATPLGDPTEIEAMRQVFSGAPGSIAIGSAKGNIGHAKYAAGAVGLLRTVLALADGMIPPHAGFREPNPNCRFDETPFRIPTSAEEWPADRPTAGVSAFGFGGIDYHVVLERHDPPLRRAARRRALRPPLGLGVIAFGAASRPALAGVARTLLGRDPRALAEELARGAAPADQAVRAAFFAETPEAMREALQLLADVLDKGGSTARLEAAGIALREGPGFGPGEVALMFPGQGSQYVGMLDELRKRYPIVQATFDEADEVMADLLPKKLSEYVFPDKPDGRAFFELTKTEVLQPAMIAADEALRRLLSEVLEPAVVLGHSLGEYAANLAADTLDFRSTLRIVAGRGTAMAAMSGADPGIMVGVGVDEARVRKLIEGVEGYVDVVNKNCPTQTIIGGATAAVREADKRLKAAGLETMSLPVSHAFHSAIVEPASKPLRGELDKVTVRGPRLPILSNIDASLYPRGEGAPTWIRDSLARQMASPVEWIGCVEKAYQLGARVFIECGPKRALTGFTADILKGRPHRAIQLVHPKTGELVTFGRAIAALVAEGVIAYGAHMPRTQRLPMGRRPPYVNELDRAPLVEETPIAPPAPAPAPPIAAAPVAQDPRFWQFLAAQGPAIASWIESSFKAALALGGGFPAMAPAVAQAPTAPAPAVQAPPAQASIAPASATPAVSRSAAVAPAPPAPTASAAPATRPLTPRPVPTPGPGDLTSWVLERVADKTGYAPSELSLTANLESELGIDSVRQIEIVLEIRDALKLPPDEGFRMSEHPTLAALVAYLQGRLDAAGGKSATATAGSPPAPAPAAPAASEAPLDVTRFVLSEVAEKTGYAIEELTLDAQLESELGIDSVRQIEIVLSVRDQLKLPPDESFRVSDYPTLRSLVGYMSSRLGGDARPF